MKDLIAKSPYAEIREVKKNLGEENNQNVLRVYPVQWPDVFVFQLRTFKPITSILEKRSKPRNMIAHVHLSLTEMEEILAYMKDYTGKAKRVNTQPLELVSSDES